MTTCEVAELTGGTRVLVCGARVTGDAVVAALTGLADLGLRITVCDDDEDALQRHRDAGHGALTTAAAQRHMADQDLVIVSPGFGPSAPVVQAAVQAGLPIWGDVELAWRLDASGRYGRPKRWVVVTGTNGKTTTTAMVHDMLTAAGGTSALCGNIGDPVLNVLDRDVEFLAVELSSFQLHWAPSVRPVAGAVLNVAEDHLDWHGGMEGYTRDKARALDGEVAVAGLDDAIAGGLLAAAAAPVKAGFRAAEPAVGELGVLDGWLVDRAFGVDIPLIEVSKLPVGGPIGVLNALAAAALARAVGTPAVHIARALEVFQVGRHRAELIARVADVAYVDDSKATNPHAAAASIAGYPRVVWIAGGLLKGAAVDDLVRDCADRLGAVVLIGRDRALIAEALARHAPDVPVVAVVTREDAGVQEANVVYVTDEADGGGADLGTRVMAAAVRHASSLARPGDTVLLAPAGASFDQFSGYSERGDRFAAAVHALTG
ncbi:UDP-N-acetylmuramoyl-L-alanine--D-glutamate ligase [Mycobacteroides abscessus]|uniref:UDP-N-acetylmuramoyl-L-alanine--D-glutamate ligase n=1 Tax=Mycobacteroides abscessus TaxID=36809 RepID=UPI0009267F6A|nr:UDP-N-acetylmuramoyl-L-alanine--D-glutamate ligase [Mycobacteroides abscessus]SIN55044.1 UDP-N-acetylmuramoyl-L-alanyl-D-glutamate synthetase [Mycobacteroides abscessus subsp. abscessus]